MSTADEDYITLHMITEICLKNTDRRWTWPTL